MDLREINAQYSNRHPWELARVAALKKILSRVLSDGQETAILDLGCGDGFASREVFKENRQAKVTCLDIFLTPDQISELKETCPQFEYETSYQSLGKKSFDLILMLDVIEHEEDDRALLKRMMDHHLAPGGSIVIFAPAFPLLFGDHDRFLKHFRRYKRKGLINLVTTTGLEVVSSGYLFFLLLFPRFLSVLLQNILGPASFKGKGIGKWDHGRLVTSFFTFLLNIDNTTLLWLNKVQFHLPGLSLWVICRKPPLLSPVTTKPTA